MRGSEGGGGPRASPASWGATLTGWLRWALSLSPRALLSRGFVPQMQREVTPATRGRVGDPLLASPCVSPGKGCAVSLSRIQVFRGSPSARLPPASEPEPRKQIRRFGEPALRTAHADGSRVHPPGFCTYRNAEHKWSLPAQQIVPKLSKLPPTTPPKSLVQLWW